jgi:hypothetical protein
MAKRAKVPTLSQLILANDFGKLSPGYASSVRRDYRLVSIKFQFEQRGDENVTTVELSNANALTLLRWLDANGFCD